MGNPLDVLGWHMTWGSFYALYTIEAIAMFALGYRYRSRWERRR